MRIEDINKKIRELNKLKRLLNMNIDENDPVEEKIFKKYLELENVSKVAKYINDERYRVVTKNGCRKYTANDISYVINDKDIKIKSNELQKVVRKIFNQHKRGVKIIKL